MTSITQPRPGRSRPGRPTTVPTTHLERLMPTSPTPADQLRAAAMLLRDKATAAIHEDRTTWSTGHTLGSKSPVVLDHPEQPSVLIEIYAARLERVNSYLALLGPATGLALAELLGTASRFAALHADLFTASTGRAPAEADLDTATRAALAVARQLLGTTTSEDGRCPVMTPGGRCEKDADHRAGSWPDDPHTPAAAPAAPEEPTR